jgi:hypothetical protein
LEVTKENEAGVANILDVNQQVRLRQIDWQVKGPWAFREQAVVAALKLTAAQQQQIRLIEAERMLGPGPGGPRPDFGRHEGPRGPGPHFGPRAMGPKDRGPDEMRRAEVERVLTLLTDDQRARWNELTGREFKSCPPPFGRFGLPPDGPPPGPPPDDR